MHVITQQKQIIKFSSCVKLLFESHDVVNQQLTFKIRPLYDAEKNSIKSATV